ncbi:hypothetical protein BH09MYX1_BH09MYX1_38930 [soil metagenome]
MLFETDVLGHSEPIDDPYSPLPESTVWLSTQVTSYSDVVDYALGADGRRVRLLFPQTFDTYLYDTAPFVHTKSSLDLIAVSGVPFYDLNVDGVVIGSSNKALKKTVTLKSTQYAHLQRSEIHEPAVDFNVL